MKRVYEANLDVMDVPCATAATLLDGGGASSSAGGSARLRRVALVVVDAEGEDDRVVSRLLEMGGGAPPAVVVYEQSHLRGARRAALAQRLRAAGMVAYNRTAMRAPPRRGVDEPLGAASWAQVRHVLAHLERTAPSPP